MQYCPWSPLEDGRLCFNNQLLRARNIHRDQEITGQPSNRKPLQCCVVLLSECY